MTQTERLNTQKGAVLLVEKRAFAGALEIALRSEKLRDCVLHWGVRRDVHGPWQVPAQSVWPKGSKAYDHKAVQTPFLKQNGAKEIIFKLGMHPNFALIDFVLYFPEERSWDNNFGRDYRIEVPAIQATALTPEDILKEGVDVGRLLFHHSFHLDGGRVLSAAVYKDQQNYRISLVTDLPGHLVLHWGISRHKRRDWALPPTSMFPPGTRIFQDRAAQTSFSEYRGFRRIDLDIKEPDIPAGLPFVLKVADEDRWIKDRGQNFHLPVALASEPAVSLGDAALSAVAEEIIEREVSRNSWTLMHRFNLCYDLLDKMGDGDEGLALIYVWLRFSALRQLDWQRNYNTKPKELGHAMDRLTGKLADAYADKPNSRELIRLIMTTLGRGTDAQRVRDEVLQIMHRHHIKEISGHFMEEWHQKLHNNATPDDIVICEAFLEFLRNNGDLNAFYQRLEESDVTRERLQSFERPIKSDPDFIPQLKDALIKDFEYFLEILKEVHSGTDLGAAIRASRHLFDENMNDLMDFIWNHRDGKDVSVHMLVEKGTDARRLLSRKQKERTSGLRELLFLDLALEEFLRVASEGSIGVETDGDELVRWIELILENLTFSSLADEFTMCRRQWQRLMKEVHFTEEWSLQAKSVIDRLERTLGAFIEGYAELFQPKAEFLGGAFGAEPWAVCTFTEEVVRGRLHFVLSLLLRYLDRVLRERAHLGSWQLISPGRTTGRVEVVSTLGSIQGKRFSQATVLIADRVRGDEEIPEGVVAVITSDATDILSHVAIRARNAAIFFASCYEPEEIRRLKTLSGKTISISVSATYDVVYEETSDAPRTVPRQTPVLRDMTFRPVNPAYAISGDEFNERVVGGKSNNLRRLRGKLPKWVGLPASVALPFGVFEQVLAAQKNLQISAPYEELSKQVEEIDEDERTQRLSDLRKLILDMAPPEELFSSLASAMNTAGVPPPRSWENAWMSIKRVWASKWNERAFLSRMANGIPHDNLLMAVLIQEVVEADYAFVVHTVNPSTGQKDQGYAEVVLGLGETLVGNYPGRALSFTWTKEEHQPRILTFPSKSVALYGNGLIFRSDSNGEDMEAYAGAGLYDSFMDPPPRETHLDYTRELLLWNEHFRNNLLVTIALIGTMIEKAMGSPQDIEGAYSKGQYYVLQTRHQVGVE